MNKIISFLKESNRYKHLIGGLLEAKIWDSARLDEMPIPETATS